MDLQDSVAKTKEPYPTKLDSFRPIVKICRTFVSNVHSQHETHRTFGRICFDCRTFVPNVHFQHDTHRLTETLALLLVQRHRNGFQYLRLVYEQLRQLFYTNLPRWRRSQPGRCGSRIPDW